MKTAVLAVAAAVAAAHPTFDAAEFKAVGPAPAGAEMTFTVALATRNADVMDATLQDISDPRSPKYGQWLSQEEVARVIAPSAEDRAEVRAYATSTGATCVDFPASLRCTATVAQVESLLKTKVTEYSHLARDGRTLHRVAPGKDVKTLTPPPAALAGKLSFMTSLIDFPTIRMRQGKISSAAKTEARALQATDYSILPETLKAMYKIKGAVADVAGSTAGPLEFQADQAWLASDNTYFAQQAGVAPWNVSTIVGSFSGSDTEATLDEEYLGVLSAGFVGQWFEVAADWVYEWADGLTSLPASQVSDVYSVSWGWWEGDQCTIDSTGPCSSGSDQAYVTQTNTLLAGIAARGVSILVSSGDSGAHGRTDSGCSSPQTRAAFPSSSPYVTSVGATQLQNGGNPLANPTSPYCQNPANGPCGGSGVEIVASTATNALIVSGGGFSMYANTPAWQQAAVTAYLASGVTFPGAGNFNSTGRAAPDVSALGHNYNIYQQGSWESVDGTSCSAPVWGGIVGLLNAARTKAGKPVLGFLNPFLYQTWAKNKAAFTDVTIGDNTCTEDGCTPGCTGFYAAPGYDATSGLGTPIFTELLAAAKAI